MVAKRRQTSSHMRCQLKTIQTQASATQGSGSSALVALTATDVGVAWTASGEIRLSGSRRKATISTLQKVTVQTDLLSCTTPSRSTCSWLTTMQFMVRNATCPDAKASTRGFSARFNNSAQSNGLVPAATTAVTIGARTVESI